MLVLHVADALQNAAANGVAKVLSGRLGVNITQVYGPVEPLVSRDSHGIRGERRIRRERRERLARVDRRERCRLRNERLSGSGLSGLSSGLLRLGNVSTAVLAIVNTFAGPCRLSRQSVHNLQGNASAVWTYVTVINAPS